MAVQKTPSPSQPPSPYGPPAASPTPWFAVSVGLAGLIVGYMAGTTMRNPTATAGTPSVQVAQNPTPAAPQPEAPTGTAPTPGVGPTLGSKNAPITLVEFTDFQCPYCGRHFSETFGKIKQDYVDTGKVKYEIRNLPLTSIHPNAQAAAEAALCADKQGKFWDMHDALFTNQQTWSGMSDPQPTFAQYAKDIGLNAGKFKTCVDNHETAAQVQKDSTDGNTAGINGTPGFWILGPNGKTQQVSGAYPYDTFKAAFDGMLQ